MRNITIVFVLVFLVASPILLASEPTTEYTVTITVTATTKSDGSNWDGSKDGKFPSPPDPYIVIDNTAYKSASCKDSLSCCVVKFTSKQKSGFFIQVFDADLAQDDFMGAGECSIGKNRLKSVELEIE